ncbi:metallophosphoesterase, partial [Enterobacter sp.]
MYQRIEGGMWRHVWVVSDIHGCYQWLMDELKRRHFNPYEDLLISVGDVIDRGPDSVKCLQLIHEKWGNDSNLLIVFYVQIMPD